MLRNTDFSLLVIFFFLFIENNFKTKQMYIISEFNFLKPVQLQEGTSKLDEKMDESKNALRPS